MKIDINIDVTLDNVQTAKTKKLPKGTEQIETKTTSPDRMSLLMTKFTQIIADTQMSDESQLLEHLQRNIERQISTNQLPTLPTL